MSKKFTEYSQLNLSDINKGSVEEMGRERCVLP